MSVVMAVNALEARYRLVELEREELKIQCKVDDFHQWGAPALDAAGYQQKEALQRATPHSKRGSIFWALVERNAASSQGSFGEDSDVNDEGIVPGVDLILCHCESHMFDCVFRKRNGEIVHGYSHHIGSVFTLPSHRGQGLARFFLTSLAKRLAKRPDAVGSVLYSDIGPTFYDTLGWRLHSSDMAELNLASPKNMKVVQEGHTDSAAPLYLDEALDAFLAVDNKRLETEMRTSAYNGKEVFAPLPTRDSIEWQFCLGQLYAKLRGFPTVPKQCGLKIYEDAFVIWCHNLKESTLYIVHARFPADDPDATIRLLRAAIVEAAKYNLQSVAIWDPSAALLDNAITTTFDIVKTDREDSLSSLMVFNQHREEATLDLPIWLNNEKMAWV
ncbi:hypothetical protein Poli38472_002131 [Pythium oligandrum]|uniref:LYC1 C-terminal domain-containing protein n=1 Tax=Pythium oligandrum TaxID=41045 RepID=A0A8K1CH87_PYTOL|nr:hypothetical protein Poli38472_002131 [Pythium oligandrum]|eukprot:TMW63190.1 hypothetical protein Poli38472_002131 [Pythium oligandrum]